MGEKKARRDTGSKVGAAIVECGEKEDDGRRAEGEGTVLCRAARFPRSEAHPSVRVCVGEHTGAQQPAAAVPPPATAALRRAILARLRFAGSGRAGTRGRHLPRTFLASVPVCPLSPQRGMAES